MVWKIQMVFIIIMGSNFDFLYNNYYLVSHNSDFVLCRNYDV